MAKYIIKGNLISLDNYLKQYFNSNIAPIANRAVENSNAVCAKAMRDSIRSNNGKSIATGGVPGFDVMLAESSFAENDSCKYYWSNVQSQFRDGFEKDKALVEDVGRIITEYQKVMIKNCGKEHYDAESKKLGCDLATWYVNNKIVEMSLNKMASRGTAFGTVDYLMRKGAQTSLLGLGSDDWEGMITLQERQYGASAVEKTAAYAVGGLIDFAVLPYGGFSSAVKLGAVGAGIDLVFKNGSKQTDLDGIASTALFGKSTVLDSGRKSIKVEKEYMQRLNATMTHQVSSIGTPAPKQEEQKEQQKQPEKENEKDAAKGKKKDKGKTENKDTNNGKSEDNKTQAKAKDEESKTEEKGKGTDKNTEEKAGKGGQKASEDKTSDKDNGRGQQEGQATVQQTQNTQSYSGATGQTNYGATSYSEAGFDNGWGNLMDTMGLGGFSDVFKNLGYVMAMLPDMMIGMLTGRTKTLGLKDNLLPVAAVVAGLFVRNPLLKLLLMGLGGANLLNKATHEALEASESNGKGYKEYKEEKLNARITGPQLNGNVLVASIDGIPCMVTLQDNVIAAYNEGVLPLSTLCNAVVAKYDEQRQQAAMNYDRAETEEREKTEERERTMAIK